MRTLRCLSCAALVTVLAGYWRPSMQTRFRIWLFFRLVWAQRLFGFSPRFTALQASHRRDSRTSGL